MTPPCCQLAVSSLHTTSSCRLCSSNITFFSRSYSSPYLQQGPALLLPQLHPDGDVVDFW